MMSQSILIIRLIFTVRVNDHPYPLLFRNFKLIVKHFKPPPIFLHFIKPSSFYVEYSLNLIVIIVNKYCLFFDNLCILTIFMEFYQLFRPNFSSTYTQFLNLLNFAPQITSIVFSYF